MTDTIIDDDIIDVPSSNTRSSTSSVTAATTTRRPMFIETEVRTDTVTTRRMATAAANRSVHDVLENTRSPNEGRQHTSYSYAQSSAYAPGSRPGSYDIPAMSRRNLHGGQESNESAFSSPSAFLSSVRSQINNGVSAIRDRLFHGNDQNREGGSSNSPSNGLTNAGTRFSRTSSQSSATGSRSSGYNLRSRPVHSTPRDQDHDQQRKTGSKLRKDDQAGEIDEEDNENENDDKENDQPDGNNTVLHYLRKILHSPVDIFDSFWSVLKGLPLWLLIPLLILFGLYTLPYLACKPFQYYPIAKVNDVCRDVHHHTDAFNRKAYQFTRRHTYDRGLRNLKQFYTSAHDLKDSLASSLSDIFASARQSLHSSVGDVKERVADVVESATENAKGYCDAGVQKMNKVLEELKHEREKYLGARHTLTPDQEKELQAMVRQIIDEYTADETGQADYAMEANGGKVIDTRCSEYTDEPRQNVVKFLGIPIVHMSKQPDIILKPGRMPGQCFPFKGDHGSIIIRLAIPVIPTEFVLEHLSKSISIVGHINSAPKNFTVFALKDKHDKEGTPIGRYFYDAENGPALQRFKPQAAQGHPIEYIELQVTSNWGNPTYTCIYRFRVHGDMQSIVPSAPPAA